MTSISPLMYGWIPQIYEKVPAVSNVCANLAPDTSVSLWNTPSLETILCANGSPFVQVTVAPTFTASVPPPNAKSMIITPDPPATTGGTLAVVAADPGAAGAVAADPVVTGADVVGAVVAGTVADVVGVVVGGTVADVVGVVVAGLIVAGAVRGGAVRAGPVVVGVDVFAAGAARDVVAVAVDDVDAAVP